MTALFTASYRAYRQDMGQAVVTSLGLPKWRMDEAEQWPRCWLLTPTSAMFHAGGDEFTEAYVARLDRFGPARIGRTLEGIARDHGTDRIVLLCHEANWNQCHRQLIADWLLARSGEAVTEIT